MSPLLSNFSVSFSLFLIIFKYNVTTKSVSSFSLPDILQGDYRSIIAIDNSGGTANIADLEITQTRTAIAFYNTTGVKLEKAPESGLYIILYDDGSTEKVLK